VASSADGRLGCRSARGDKGEAGAGEGIGAGTRLKTRLKIRLKTKLATKLRNYARAGLFAAMAALRCRQAHGLISDGVHTRTNRSP
jgi:hypothetical protein